MIRIFIFSFLLFGLLYLISELNIMAIFAHKVMFYIALALFIGALIVAKVVLHRLSCKRMKNEEDDK